MVIKHAGVGSFIIISVILDIAISQSNSSICVTLERSGL